MSGGSRSRDSRHDKRLCIGCGVCAGVCPRGKIEIAFGDDGCYRAIRAEQACSESCGLCERVCPFFFTGHDEDSIGKALYGDQPGVRHSLECGYYSSCSSGYCSDVEQRLNSASGGLASAFLKRLLADGVVDKAVCVTRCPGSTPLFRYSIIDKVSDLGKAAKSAYYPVELSAILREVTRSDAKYALVCLPCVAKALRLAQMQVPVLREKIAVIVGLVCGHGVSSQFAEFAGELAGAPNGAISEVVFRTKTPSLPASELGTLVRWRSADDGAEEATVYWSSGLGEAWSGHWFTPEACLYCDDVFAECADVVFMDAWLPEFANDYRGTSLLVVRSQLARSVFEAAANAGEIALRDCEMGRVIESQEEVIAFKREGMAHRLWRASRGGLSVPEKRVVARNAGKWYAASAYDAEAKRAIEGSFLWKRRRSLEEFQTAMREIQGDPPRWIRARRCAKRIVSGLRSRVRGV